MPFLRIVLAAAAWLLKPFEAAMKISSLIFEGRLLIEYHAGLAASAEDIFFQYAKRRQLTFWAVSTYITKVVDPGHSRRLEEIRRHPHLSPGAAALLAEAASRLASSGPNASSRDFGDGQVDQLKYHERLAEDGLTFMRAEPDYIDLTLPLSTALSAEACEREEIFAASITLLTEQLSKVERSRPLSRAHIGDVVAAKLSLFDLHGALKFLDHPNVVDLAKAGQLRVEVGSLIKETERYDRAIRMANEDVLARAAGVRTSLDKRPVLLMPAAAFRKNKIDYPGFRADIRFVLSAMFAALEKNDVPYSVRSRLRTHGFIDLPVPSFSYHTISHGNLGLHFKETDRPSLFSLDSRGYAGWSDFSDISLEQLRLTDVDQQHADAFFEDEKRSVIGGNLSKYRQASVSYSENLPENFIFVALQLIGDAVSQLAYLSLFEMVEEVVRTAEAKGLSVVIKRHPLCTTPEVSRFLSKLVAEGRVIQVYSSIHAIIPKALAVCVVNSGVGAEALLHEKPVYVFGRADYMAGCFVCRQPGDFTAQFVAEESRLTPDELRKFWFLLRKRYAIDLRDRERAAVEIEARVMVHLRSATLDEPSSQSF
ncbi:hypothetical protein [Rhizobium wenxiniae]|uniref:capsular polysaccharide export protein, LipB/KpsS family n=1 Tax=Rhizobium wenxiniae TaxID=1737357 RepID=UPI003C14959A